MKVYLLYMYTEKLDFNLLNPPPCTVSLKSLQCLIENGRWGFYNPISNLSIFTYTHLKYEEIINA